MKKLILFAIALLSLSSALAAQEFDFKTLDKLGARAKSTTNVTLDGNMLKLAAAFLGSNNDKDTASLRDLVNNLKAVYVRAWEFDKPGEYAESDLEPLRVFLRQSAWKNVVDVKDEGESTQVYLLPAANNKLGGVAVVASEPLEVTVVYINGTLDLNSLEKLSGNIGIPDLKGLTGGKSATGGGEKKTK